MNIIVSIATIAIAAALIMPNALTHLQLTKKK